MTKLELLTKAVEDKCSISFQYNKPGKAIGTRVGNPHAVFIFTSKKGTTSTKVHIYQTGGVSDTAGKGDFPFWRPFNIEELTDVKILVDEEQFEIADGYNPESYDKPLAKV